MRLFTCALIAATLALCASQVSAVTFTPVSSTLHSHAFTNGDTHIDKTLPDVVNGAVYGTFINAPSLTSPATGVPNITGEMAIDLTLQPEMIKFGGAGHGQIIQPYNSGGDSHAEAVVDITGATDFTVGIGKDQLTNFQMSLTIKDNLGATVYTRSATPGTTSFPTAPVLSFFPLSLSPGRYTFIADNLENGNGFGNAVITIAPVPEPAIAGLLGLFAIASRCRRSQII